MTLIAEEQRLADTASGTADWQRWGTYVSDRAWGTVREDYSADGRAWEYFPHDHARSRAYRWNEDALAGFCDREQHLCMGVALWNERDPILKERLFGLSNREGNHGEDVKEYYFYLDNTPTHAYARMLYRYPQAAFPYAGLVAENTRRNAAQPEYELLDALADDFQARRYFDVFVDYAKHDAEDILCRIEVINRGPEPAAIHVLPHLWYRNTWSWTPGAPRFSIHADGPGAARSTHPVLGERWWYVETDGSRPGLMFTENDTNTMRLFGAPNSGSYVKDGINDAVVDGQADRVNGTSGSKVAADVRLLIDPGASAVVRVRLSPQPRQRPFAAFDSMVDQRRREADEFYDQSHAAHLTPDERLVQRQAYAGLLWSKQFYHFDVHHWLAGDPAQPPPPSGRRAGRNRDWAIHLHNADVILMPDKWEYPWYASWDLAFHVVVMAQIDPAFAKQQLLMLTLPRFQHPYGTVPAYEWDFGAVNPPVLAWAALQVYYLDRAHTGEDDATFLASMFDSLILMLGWWINRKDSEGKGIFGGGFLGLDNIGVFERDQPLPAGGTLEQSDGTGWMAMFQMNMAAIAAELSLTSPRYGRHLPRFGQHMAILGTVLQSTGAGGIGLWDDDEKFYFDVIRYGTARIPLKLFSMVGLVPLFAVLVGEAATLDRMPDVVREADREFERRRSLQSILPGWLQRGKDGTRMLSIVDRERLTHLLQRVLDEGEFLSEYGVRSMSRRHLAQPFQFSVDGMQYQVSYQPGASDSRMFGGNSNWRGPIWFPMNFLLIQSIARFGRYYDDAFTVEYPAGSHCRETLPAIAADLSQRLTRIFVRDDANGGRRAVFGGNELFQQDVLWRDYIPFHEYFHGETGEGVGASHQTGWTSLVALLLQYGGQLCFETLPIRATANGTLEHVSTSHASTSHASTEHVSTSHVST